MSMKIEGNPAPLFEALAKARASFKPVHFDNEGQIQNRRYKYATLAAILESVTPALSENGLTLLHTRGSLGNEEVFTHILAHSSGTYIVDEQRIPAIKTVRDDKTGEIYERRLTEQEFGSAYTYSRRYFDQGVLSIAAEEDDDGAEASKPQERRPRQEAPAPRPEPKAAPAVSPRPASAPPPRMVPPDHPMGQAQGPVSEKLQRQEWDVAKGEPKAEEEDSRPAQSDPELDRRLSAAFGELRKSCAIPVVNTWARKITGKPASGWTVSDGKRFLEHFDAGERP